MSNKDNDSNDGSVNDNAKQEEDTKPLATTRSRRANAGNLMGQIIQEEEDILYSNLYGGFYEEEDDKDFDDDGEANDDDAEDDSEADSDSSSDEEDDDSGPEYSPVKQEPKRKTTSNKDPEPSSHSTMQPGSPTRAAYDSCKKICSVCLGDQSDGDDEIIECDACGVSVHESCYGVSGEDHAESVHSNLSSESTEPWFCEPCKRSVMNPLCELCPNTGGIFKQTDTGRWIHMVCALYTRGVTFENIENLSEISLFELNYGLYGSKACTICEDRRLARSGVCIDCDAGLCNTFFHATCAQKEGLLFESHSDEVDPYFAQCKQHADKTIIRKKKRLYTALHARFRRIKPLETCSERIKTKLAEITQEPDPHLSRWKPDNRPPLPPRVGRMLMTSPSLILKLTKKSELMGLDPTSAFMSVQDEMESARQKWHIPPAFNLEFVAYCRDRSSRMGSMKEQNNGLVDQNITLKKEEVNLRERYNSIRDLVGKMKLENDTLIKEAYSIQKVVTTTTGKQFNLPIQMEQLMARRANPKVKDSNKADATKTSVAYGCGRCGKVNDQHLMALCDTCKSYIHIYCLDPPLTRVPKKTKFGGWQCSDCSEKDEDEQEEALEEQNTLAMQEADGPRRLRERIKYPDKYCHESMLLADFWSTHKRKSKKSSKSTKRAKVEPS